MQPKQLGERGISYPLFQGEEVSMNKVTARTSRGRSGSQRGHRTGDGE